MEGGYFTSQGNSEILMGAQTKQPESRVHETHGREENKILSFLRKPILQIILAILVIGFGITGLSVNRLSSGTIKYVNSEDSENYNTRFYCGWNNLELVYTHSDITVVVYYPYKESICSSSQIEFNVDSNFCKVMKRTGGTVLGLNIFAVLIGVCSIIAVRKQGIKSYFYILCMFIVFVSTLASTLDWLINQKCTNAENSTSENVTFTTQAIGPSIGLEIVIELISLTAIFLTVFHIIIDRSRTGYSSIPGKY